MKKRIKYTKGPVVDLRIIEDFLPSPEELGFKEEKMKVTLALSKSSVEFFKRKAKEYHTQYQKMIRRLVDSYASKHQ